MPSPATCPTADLRTGIAAQRAAVAGLERALWAGGFDEALLAPYQAACRELERLISASGEDRRHHFLIVIPVADSPVHLGSSLESLVELCRTYGYGGQEGGRWRKVSVLLADDSGNALHRARNRTLIRELDEAGLTAHYFGPQEQLALFDRLDGVNLAPILGVHPREAFHHKGQAVTRNLAWLRCAELAAARPDVPLLVYTVDADQVFRVHLATAEGSREVCALNYLHHLDEIFRRTDALVLTGKVVGDPPVSPAVMAGNFLEDVLGFLREMAAAEPDRPYPQPEPAAGGDAAYHDMAELFGFERPAEAYRYRCAQIGQPDHAACFAEFAGRLHRFFHGEHPTRVTGYRYEDALASVQRARTVYTGNYVFRIEALAWFIPFAPLRLRMSGPTLGRMLKAELGPRFASANLPMLHRRTLEDSGQSEFRPGVHDADRAVDLSDEFERQFHGDVLLFAMERLTALGYPGQPLTETVVDATLAGVQAEMRRKYHAARQTTLARLDRLTALLDDPRRWWNRRPDLAAAVSDFHAFAANLERNFGRRAPCFARLDDHGNLAHWRARQCRAIVGYPDHRRVWELAMRRLGVLLPPRDAS